MIQQITHDGYCFLGGARNPNLFSRPVYVGGKYRFTQYFMHGNLHGALIQKKELNISNP